MSKAPAMDVGKSKGASMGLSYPMLTKTNYTAWSMKMKVFMQAHGVWEAVESSDAKATVEDRTDKIVLAMIYQGISKEILLSLAEKKKAKDAWDGIKVLCQGAERAKAAKVQTLKAEFEALSMKDTEEFDDFCMKLSGLVTHIRELGEEVKEAYVVKKLLRAVPFKFLKIASTMEQFGNLETMTVEETVGSLKAHEERLRGQTETRGSKLLLTEEEWARKENDEGKLLLTREEWLKKSSKPRGVRDKSKVRCFNCHVLGHYAAECRKPRCTKDVKPEAYMAQTDDEEPALLLAKHEKNDDMVLLNERSVVPVLATYVKRKGAESNLWYLDNGASNHMTGERAKFKELDEKITGQVKFGDGSTVKIEGKGSIVFKCRNGEERTLNEVYFIPTLCRNIISLGQLSEEGNKVILNGNYLWVYEKQGKLLMKVKRSPNRLYRLIIDVNKPSCLLSKSEEVSRL